MKTLRTSLTLIAVLACWLAKADELPDPPAIPRLVNDLAGVIDDTTEAALEDSLYRFEKRTSNEVCIITVNDLQGYNINEYAQLIAQKWGVGKASKNNGVLIIVKTKQPDSKGQAFIATGYGLESALPDVICTNIVRKKMIPSFIENDYSQGIAMAAVAVMQACEGEYSADITEDDDDEIGLAVLALFIGFIIFSVYISYKEKRNRLTSDRGFTWFLLNSMLTQSSSRSDWGSFSSGRGSFGGGGFGGFGGGSFGGGGGGGSW